MTHALASSVHVGQSHISYLQNRMWFCLHDDIPRKTELYYLSDDV